MIEEIKAYMLTEISLPRYAFYLSGFVGFLIGVI